MNYDKVRMDIYKRHVAAGGSAPGTPTSTTRKSLAQLQLQLPGPATHASPRSSFTSSSPTSTTNFSISNTPPRSFHAPNNSASATSAAAPATTATMAPLPSGRSSVHDRKDNEIATATATVTTTAAPSVATPVMSTSISNNNSSSIATPQSSEVHRRQMLITSLFPRSVTVQDSTGIEGISFQPAAVSPAKEEAATAPSSSSSAQAPPAPGNAGRPAKADLCGAEETRSGRSGVVARANNNYEGEDCVISDAQEMAQEDGYDSDEGDCYDSSSDADVDEAETRTNPSVSLRSYSLYDNDDAEEEGGGVSERGDAEFKPTEDHHHGRVRGIAHQVDDSVWHGSGSSSEQDSNSSVSSTSAGADDELPNSPHPHTAGAGAGGGGVGGGMAHMQHNIPHTTTTTHHHAKGGVSRGGALTSESDEGNDFYANMQKFIRGFQESHLVDISDSEVDFDHQRPNNAVATAPGTGIAASSKRRASAAAKSKSGHSHAHGHTNGAKTAKNDLTDKSGRVVTLVSDAPPAHGKKSSKR